MTTGSWTSWCDNSLYLTCTLWANWQTRQRWEIFWRLLPFGTLERFNYWICNRGTKFCPVLSWHHLLFGIRFYCCALLIKYWFLESRYSSVLVSTSHLLFPFIVFHCVLLFYQQLTSENLRVREISSILKTTNPPPRKISISIVVTRILRDRCSCV